MTPADEMAFLADLQPLVANPYATPETEDLEIRIEPRDRESVVIGIAYLENAAPPRLQVIADILSKSALLSLYKKIASEVDRIEPLAAKLDGSGLTWIRFA